MVEKTEEIMKIMGVEDIEVRRIGLTIDQVREFNPPPSFAKETSSRYDAYVLEQGTDQAWELDALEPEVIQQLIQTEIDLERDEEIWEARMEAESESKRRMEEISNRYREIIEFLDEDEDYDEDDY